MRIEIEAQVDACSCGGRVREAGREVVRGRAYGSRLRALLLAGLAAAAVTRGVGTSEAAGYPEIDFGPALSHALAAPLLTLGDVSNSVAPPLRAYPPFVLALNSRIGLASTRAASAARLKASLGNFLAGDNTSGKMTTAHRFTGCFNHHMSTICLAMALARHTPDAWNGFPADLRARMDAYMRFPTYEAAMFVNAGHNNGNNHVNWDRWNVSYSNPNQNTPYWSALAAVLYWGDAAALNKVLSAYTQTGMLAACESYGWTRFRSIWSMAHVLASLDSGTGYGATHEYPGTNRYDPAGVKLPFNQIRGYVVSGDTVTCPAPAIDLTPMNVFRRMAGDFVISRPVKDAGCGTGDSRLHTGNDRYGHIKPGYSTPHHGVVCVDLEQDMPDCPRASQHYAATSFLHVLPAVCALRALGHWPSNHAELDSLALKTKRYGDVVVYRIRRWWDPSKPADHNYGSEPDSPFWANQYWPTLKARILDDLTLSWPSTSAARPSAPANLSVIK
ncbi:MAG: hypothetical protein JXR37_14160 [Kiritimatiellae bacterium]|nr:hypothetical protein [Kiritimatiellia bacterium]